MSFVAILIAVLKAVPELIGVYKQLRQHLAEVERANQEKSAYERLQSKKNATRDLIRAANERVFNNISSQTEQFRKNSTTTSGAVEQSSNTVS